MNGNQTEAHISVVPVDMNGIPLKLQENAQLVLKHGRTHNVLDLEDPVAVGLGRNTLIGIEI
ncbi:MAG: hypothetical protein RLZZ198_1935 [Bacteroidota bacterium]